MFIVEKFRKLAGKKTGFAGDVLKLVSGTTLAQLVSILVTPVMTRLYLPEVYGTAALFASITGILGICACMRYEMAIMLPESDDEAANLVGVSMGFSVLISLLLLPLVWWWWIPFVGYLNAPGLEPYRLLVPLSVLMSGTFLALQYWSIRARHFWRLSISNVTNSLSTRALALGLGFSGFPTAGSMIGAGFAGQAVGISVLGNRIWKGVKRLTLGSINGKKMISLVKRHKRFPIFSTWASLLNTISWQLPILMFGVFFSPEIVGFYVLGFNMLQMPMTMIGGAIGQVFHQRAAEAKIHGTLAPLTEGIIHRLVVLSLFPMLMLTIVGRDFYVVLFGEKWSEAGVYTQILSVWAIVWFVSSPLSILYGIHEQQQKGLFLQALIFCTRVLAIAIGVYINNVKIALFLFSISGIFVYGYLIYTTSMLSNANLKKVVIQLKKCFIITTVLLYFIGVVQFIFDKPFIKFVAGLMCVAMYLYFLHKEIVMDVVVFRNE